MKGFALFFFFFFFFFSFCFVFCARGGVFVGIFDFATWFFVLVFFLFFFFLGLFWMETLLLLPFVSREKISVVVVMANVIYIYTCGGVLNTVGREEGRRVVLDFSSLFLAARTTA